MSSSKFLPEGAWNLYRTRGNMRRRLSRRRSGVGRRRLRLPVFGKRAAVLTGILILSLPTLAIQPPDAAYLQSFEKWKSELVEDLKQNWLVLAGLFWLKPGANTFGKIG